MILRCIAIDDEKSALENISIIIEKNIPNAKIIATASNIIDGIKQIRKHNPDLVFLDVSMPNGSGFDLLDIIGEINFEFVFVTAYEDYAIQAIKKSAADYILKPIDVDELKESVDKIYLKINQNEKTNFSKKFIISTLDGIEIIGLEQIIRLEAQKSYTFIILENDRKVLVTKALSELEKKLPSNLFYKCHRSHVINIRKVQKYLHQDGGIIELSNNESVPVSSSRKTDFLKLLKK